MPKAVVGLLIPGLPGQTGELGGDCGGGGGSAECVSSEHLGSWLVPDYQLDVV